MFRSGLETVTGFRGKGLQRAKPPRSKPRVKPQCLRTFFELCCGRLGCQSTFAKLWRELKAKHEFGKVWTHLEAGALRFAIVEFGSCAHLEVEGGRDGTEHEKDNRKAESGSSDGAHTPHDE